MGSRDTRESRPLHKPRVQFRIVAGRVRVVRPHGENVAGRHAEIDLKGERCLPRHSSATSPEKWTGIPVRAPRPPHHTRQHHRAPVVVFAQQQQPSRLRGPDVRRPHGGVHLAAHRPRPVPIRPAASRIHQKSTPCSSSCRGVQHRVVHGQHDGLIDNRKLDRFALGGVPSERIAQLLEHTAIPTLPRRWRRAD